MTPEILSAKAFTRHNFRFMRLLEGRTKVKFPSDGTKYN